MTEFRDIKIITDLEQGTSREVRTPTDALRIRSSAPCGVSAVR